MTSEYNDIYSLFLGKITDYELLQFNINDAYERMNEFLHGVAARPFLRKLFTEFSLDDEVMTVTYTVAKSIGEDYDAEFVPQILARGMVIEWLEPRVKSTINIAQMFAGKEQRYYSQAQHLSEIRTLLENEKAEVRKMIRDYPYARFAMKYRPEDEI